MVCDRKSLQVTFSSDTQPTDLETDLQEYEDIQSGGGKKHLQGTLADLGLVLIKAKIAPPCIFPQS